MNLTPAKTTSSVESTSHLRWTFVRRAKMLTCEIRADGSRYYDVCVVPHWDVAASVIEAYDRPAAALQRHAEIAWYLGEAGWVRVSDVAPQHVAAA